MINGIKVKQGFRSGLFTERWAWTLRDIKMIETVLVECDKPIVHVCSGSSWIGDIRIDMACVVNEGILKRDSRRQNANVIGDMCNIPLKSGSAGTVLCDPPYNYKYQDKEEDPFIFELVRILKPRGRLIFYAPWVYCHPTLKCLKITPTKIGTKRNYFKLLSESIKINGQIGDYV